MHPSLATKIGSRVPRPFVDPLTSQPTPEPAKPVKPLAVTAVVSKIAAESMPFVPFVPEAPKEAMPEKRILPKGSTIQTQKHMQLREMQEKRQEQEELIKKTQEEVEELECRESTEEELRAELGRLKKSQRLNSSEMKAWLQEKKEENRKLRIQKKIKQQRVLREEERLQREAKKLAQSGPLMVPDQPSPVAARPSLLKRPRPGGSSTSSSPPFKDFNVVGNDYTKAYPVWPKAPTPAPVQVQPIQLDPPPAPAPRALPVNLIEPEPKRRRVETS